MIYAFASLGNVGRGGNSFILWWHKMDKSNSFLNSGEFTKLGLVIRN